MFSELVARNSRRSRRENGLFFTSLLISIVAFYIILSLSHQDVMVFLQRMESSAVDRLLTLVPVLYGLTLFILFFLVYYANRFQLARRRHEFGVYLMLGMQRRKLFGMLLAEDLHSSLIALAIGLVQIMFGMVLKVVMISSTVGFRYSLGSLGWLLVILGGSLAAGLPMLNSGWVIPFYTTSSPAFYATLGVGAVLMLFFNSPGKNPLLNFGLGLWDTYNNLTGILSDVLSYIRLFAIGLSGGILATVFNALAAGFVPEGSGIVVRLLIMIPILLIGHGINLFMSTISSFVHPMRLTFVEFYKNAGFEMSMRSFEPLQKIDNSENK